MKKIIFLVLLSQSILWSQGENRLNSIQNQLDLMSIEYDGLGELVKLESNVNNVSLGNFLIGISRIHKLNMSVAPELNDITISNNFTGVQVSKVLFFLIREYQLDMEFSGGIISIKPYQVPAEVILEKEISINYDPSSNSISIDVTDAPVEKVFRSIMNSSAKNLFFTTAIENQKVTFYVNNLSLDKALQNLASTNNLTYSKSRDGSYYFNAQNDFSSSAENISNGSPTIPNTTFRQSGGDYYYYEVLDTLNKTLNVEFKEVPFSQIVSDIGTDLKIDFYTATSLDNAGNVNIKANNITFDHLMDKIFENSKITPSQGNSQNPSDIGAVYSNEPTPLNFGYKKEGNLYFFGTTDLLSVRKIEAIRLQHRSIEILGDPSTPVGAYPKGSQDPQKFQDFSTYSQQTYSPNSAPNPYGQNNNNDGFQNSESLKSLVDIVPNDIKSGLDIQSDNELNTLIVSGSSTQVERFKKFMQEIDKPIPVVLIEVMFLEINRNSTVETGISWGIGNDPVSTQGNIFPSAELTLGAKTVNKVIGGFGGLGTLNLGKVVPEFFVRIKAMEENGDLRVLSTPKISTLNGHKAVFSNSETSYYAVTTQNFLGSQNPITTEITNYIPIDAGLTLSIKPYVSGDGQVTLDIYVAQSAFNGIRIANDAPPGIDAREFSSIVRMKDQDIAVLGGLEQNLKRGSGSGVPFLARIPIIKWFFSQRKREVSKQKLTVLIKPTIIN